MKRGSLVAAAALVLGANGIALLHAWSNRFGPVESDITLTQRELTKSFNASDEDSGIALNLRWIDKQWPGLISPAPWLDVKILQEVGFDTHVALSDKAAPDFYARQRARRAFVALEYDGPSWSKWIDEAEQAQAQYASRIPTLAAKQRETSTRLVAIDASADVARLRARHPDRGSVVIVPAVIGIQLQPASEKNPDRLRGYVQEIPSSIHVPLPFSERFQRMSKLGDSAKYRVHMRYGALLEPWIVAVEIQTP